MAPVDLSFLDDFAKAYSRAALRNRHDPQRAIALEILKSQLKEQNDQADSARRIFEAGGGPAVNVATRTPQDYGGLKVIERREQEAKQRSDELAKIAAEGGSNAAERFRLNLPNMFDDPTLGSRRPLEGETDIGAIGRLYGEPLPGQSGTIPPWEGLTALKNKQSLTHDADKRKQERALLAEEAAGSSELNPILAPMFKMTPEAIGTLRREMPVKDLLATGRLSQGAERVDQGDRGLDLREILTTIAREKADREQRFEGLERLIKELTAGKIKVDTGTSGARGDEIRAGLPFVAPTKQAELDKKRKEAEVAPKATARDQDVEAYMRHFGGMSDDDVNAAIEAAPATVQGKMRQAKQAIFDQRREEILAGSGRGATAPAAASPANQARPGEEVRVSPRTGKRFVNRNGVMVEVQ